MPQTDPDPHLSFSLAGQKAGHKQKAQVPFGSCPAYGTRVSAQVALQRSLILCTSIDQSTIPFIHPLPERTFLLCIDTARWRFET